MVFATCFLSFLTLLPGLVAAKMLAFRNVMLLEGLINSAVPRCSSDFFFMAATMRLHTEYFTLVTGAIAPILHIIIIDRKSVV